MGEAKPFEFLEHVADAYIAANGKSLEEAFENAALAMFEIMTDTKTVKPKIMDEIEVEAGDEYALLYSWLEQLLVKFDIDQILYSKFKVDKIEKTPEGYRLFATVWGETFDPKRHPQRTEIKAVTYHQMRIEREGGKVRIEFILDI